MFTGKNLACKTPKTISGLVLLHSGKRNPINLCPTASAQLIECHFEYHSLLSAYKKTPRQGGSVE